MAQIYADVTGKTLTTPFETITGCLKPEHFVAIRNVPGGCGPEAMAAMFAEEEKRRECRAAFLQKRKDAENAAQDMQRAGLEAIVQNSRG